MSATDERTLTGARWSLVCRTSCPRAGCYGALGTPMREPSDAMLALFQRGHDLCNAQRDRDIDTLTALGVTCEKEAEIPWLGGTGHADLKLTKPDGSLHRIDEYTSHMGGDLPDGKAEQCAGYALADGASEAWVHVIDPQTGVWRSYELHLPGMVERVAALQDPIREWIDTHTLPERVCSKPSDAYGIGCPHVDACFADWEAPVTDQLIGLDDVLEQLADAEDSVQSAKALVTLAEESREELRAKLRGLLPEGVELRATKARIKVKRIVVRRAGSFSLSAWRKAGRPVDAKMAECIGDDSESERWYLTRWSSDGRPE